MRTVAPILLLLFTGASLVRTLARPESGRPALSLRSRVLAHLVIASWFGVGLVAQLQGGTALMSRAARGEFVVQHNPASEPVVVSSTHWLLSLALESLVIGLGPLTLALLVHYSDPAWARGPITRSLIALGVVWALVIGTGALSGFARWAAQAGG